MIKLLYAGALFLGSIATQLIAIYLMPLTRGATAFWPTAGAVACFAVFALLFSRLVATGIQLSVIVPLLASAVPLGSIFIGILAYGEAASLLKIGMLVAACLLVGGASLV